MLPVEFPGHNVVFAKDQPEYIPLPAHKCEFPEEMAKYQWEHDETEQNMFADAKHRYHTGQVVCCWKLTWRERFKILWSGLLWHEILTFHNPLQPVMLHADRPNYIPKESK